MGKECDEEGVFREPFMLDKSLPAFDQEPGLREGEEGNAEWKHDSPEIAAENAVHVEEREKRKEVFEIPDGRHVEGDPEYEQRALQPLIAPVEKDGPPAQVVHPHRNKKQCNETPAPPAV